jgi:hypothetical protein
MIEAAYPARMEFSTTPDMAQISEAQKNGWPGRFPDQPLYYVLQHAFF